MKDVCGTQVEHCSAGWGCIHLQLRVCFANGKFLGGTLKDLRLSLRSKMSHLVRDCALYYLVPAFELQSKTCICVSRLNRLSQPAKLFIFPFKGPVYFSGSRSA